MTFDMLKIENVVKAEHITYYIHCAIWPRNHQRFEITELRS